MLYCSGSYSAEISQTLSIDSFPPHFFDKPGWSTCEFSIAC